MLIPKCCLFSKVQELPEHNFETLKFLVNHLKLVSDNCDKNKVIFVAVYGYFINRSILFCILL